MNDLFNSLCGQQIANMQQVIEDFYKFRDNFSGNAREKVMELLNQGRISHTQFNQLQSMASQIQRLIK